MRDFELNNYHTHTWRCQHAAGTEEQYILRAINAGFTTLGFADHSPWPYKSDFVADMRMHISQYEDYLTTLRALREKYRGRIDIRIGLECEAFPEFYPWLKEQLESGAIDYCIMGNHYDTTDEWNVQSYFGSCRTPERAERYAAATIAGMESGLFTYVAHPDLYLNRYPKFDSAAESVAHRLCAAAERLRLPLEYNLLGMVRNPESRAHNCVGYTSDEFWNIAREYDIVSVIGIDAHTPEQIDRAEDYIRVREKLERMGIPVLDRIDV